MNDDNRKPHTCSYLYDGIIIGVLSYLNVWSSLFGIPATLVSSFLMGRIASLYPIIRSFISKFDIKFEIFLMVFWHTYFWHGIYFLRD